MKYFIILFLSLFLFNITKANETIFTCKPVYAAVQTETGMFYEETLEEMDEEAGLLSVVPISKFFCLLEILFKGIYLELSI